MNQKNTIRPSEDEIQDATGGLRPKKRPEMIWMIDHIRVMKSKVLTQKRLPDSPDMNSIGQNWHKFLANADLNHGPLGEKILFTARIRTSEYDKDGKAGKI